MKNTVKLFGIIAIIAVIGLSMVACEPENTTKDDEIIEATTAGQLTITGMDDFNGLEIDTNTGFAASDGSSFILAICERATNKYNPNEGGSSQNWETFPATVSGGQVVLKVFVNKGHQLGKGGGYQSYTGNDQDVHFAIYTSPTVQVGGVPVGMVTVNFANGIGTGVFVPVYT